MPGLNTHQTDGLMAAGTTIYQCPSFAVPPGRHISGIYGIINSCNRKIYIGSAIRMSPRWVHHRMRLNQNVHENIYLQRAFNKSPESFEFSLIETVSDKSELLKREQFWMDFYRSHKPDCGYNIAPKARSCAGVKHRPEVVARMAARLRGVKRSAEFRAKVSAALRLRVRKPMTEAVKQHLRSLRLGTKMDPESVRAKNERRKILKWGYKPVIQMSLDGNEIRRFDSVQEADGFFGKRTNIHAVLKGKRNDCLGFKWRYA